MGIWKPPLAEALSVFLGGLARAFADSPATPIALCHGLAVNCATGAQQPELQMITSPDALPLAR